MGRPWSERLLPGSNGSTVTVTLISLLAVKSSTSRTSAPTFTYLEIERERLAAQPGGAESASLSEIDSPPLCYPAFALVVPLHEFYKDEVYLSVQIRPSVLAPLRG